MLFNDTWIRKDIQRLMRKGETSYCLLITRRECVHDTETHLQQSTVASEELVPSEGFVSLKELEELFPCSAILIV